MDEYNKGIVLKEFTSSIFLIAFLISLSLFPAGCLEENPKNSSYTSKQIGLITEDTRINESLQKGPVLLMVGSSQNPVCMSQAAIFEEIAIEYESKATVIYIDSDTNPELAGHYQGKNREGPDSCVILNFKNGDYLYVGAEGEVTPEYPEGAFRGFTEKQALEKPLKEAVKIRAAKAPEGH